MTMTRAKMKDIFNELGVGKSGFISLDEFSRLCDHMGMDDLTTEELKQLYNNLDTNGDGKVNNNEFMDGMFRKESPPKNTSTEEPPGQKEVKTPEDSKQHVKPKETPVKPEKEDNNKGKSLMSDLFSAFAQDRPHYATRSGASDWLNYLDPEGTGHVSGTEVIDFLEKLGIPDGKKVLEALNFDPEGQIQPSDLSHALERELHKPQDNPLHQVAVDTVLHSTDKFWNDNFDLVEECVRMKDEVEEMKKKVKESQDDQEAMAQKKDMEIKLLQEANRKLREESSKEPPVPLPTVPPSDLKEDKEAELKKLQDDLEKQIEKLKEECDKLKEKNFALENDIDKLKKDLESADKKPEQPIKEDEKPKITVKDVQQPPLTSSQSFDIDDNMPPEEVRQKVKGELDRIQRLASMERKEAEGALMIEISELEIKHNEDMNKMKRKYEKEKADMIAKHNEEIKQAGNSSEIPKKSPITTDSGSDPIVSELFNVAIKTSDKPTEMIEKSTETSDKLSEMIEKSTETEKPPSTVEGFTQIDEVPSKNGFTERLSLNGVSTETGKLSPPVRTEISTDTENLLKTNDSSMATEIITTANVSTETEELKSSISVDESIQTDKLPSSDVYVETDKLQSTTDAEKMKEKEKIDPKEIEQMKQTHENEIKDLSGKHDRDIANLKKAHEEEVSNMKEEQDMIKSSNDQKLQDANKKVADLTEELSQIDNIIEDLEKKLEEFDQKIANQDKDLTLKDKNIAGKDVKIADLEEKIKELSTNIPEEPNTSKEQESEKLKDDYEFKIAQMKKDHEAEMENLLKNPQTPQQSRDPAARRFTMPPGGTKDDETLPKFSDLLKGFENKISESENVSKPQKKLDNITEEPLAKMDETFAEVKDNIPMESKMKDMKKNFEDEKKKLEDEIQKQQDEIQKQQDTNRELQKKIDKLQGGDDRLSKVMKEYKSKIDGLKKEKEELEKKLLEQPPSDVTTRRPSKKPDAPSTFDVVDDYEKKLNDFKTEAKKEKKDLEEANEWELQRTRDDFRGTLEQLTQEAEDKLSRSKQSEERNMAKKMKDLVKGFELKMQEVKSENDRDISMLQRQIGRRDGELKEKYEDLMDDLKNRKEEEVNLLNDIIKNLRKELADMRKNVTSQPLPVVDLGFESLQKKQMEELSKQNKKLREENFQLQADLDSKQNSEDVKADNFQKLLLHNADINTEKDLLKDQLRRTLDQLNKVTNTLTTFTSQHRADKQAWALAKEKLVDAGKHQELVDKVSKLEAINQRLQTILEHNQSDTGKVLQSTRESYDREIKDLLKEREAINDHTQKLRRAIKEKDAILLQVAEKQTKGDQLMKDLYVENSRLVKYLQQLEKQNSDANSRIQMLEEKCRILGDLVRKICPAAIG